MTRNVKKSSGSRVCQGDIIKDVQFLERADLEHGIVDVSAIVFPYVVVLTQDCDLQQDYCSRWARTHRVPEDKQLVSVLVAPLYNAEHVYLGEHLSELDLRMQTINRGKTPGAMLRSNQNPRYHHLRFPDDVQLVDLVVDFKHYFSVCTQYLRLARRDRLVCQLRPLYREDLCQRFAAFLARIATPE